MVLMGIQHLTCRMLPAAVVREQALTRAGPQAAECEAAVFLPPSSSLVLVTPSPAPAAPRRLRRELDVLIRLLHVSSSVRVTPRNADVANLWRCTV